MYHVLHSIVKVDTLDGGWIGKGAADGWVKLVRNSCRKTEYITIPHSNDSQTLLDGCLVSFFTVIPTKNVKSLTSFLAEIGCGLAKGQRNIILCRRKMDWWN